MGVRRTVHECFTCFYKFILLNIYMLSFGDQILLWLTFFRRNNNLAHPFYEAFKPDSAVNLAYDGLVFWFSCLKQFLNPWQTYCHILGLGDFSRNLCYD